MCVGTCNNIAEGWFDDNGLLLLPEFECVPTTQADVKHAVEPNTTVYCSTCNAEHMVELPSPKRCCCPFLCLFSLLPFIHESIYMRVWFAAPTFIGFRSWTCSVPPPEQCSRTFVSCLTGASG